MKKIKRDFSIIGACLPCFIFMALGLVLAAFCSGCCRRAIPLTTEKSDSVRIVREVEYIERVRDTTIYIPVPVEVKEIVVRRDSSYLSTSLAESQAIIMPDGALFHSLQNRPLSVPVVVPVVDTETKTTQEQRDVETTTIEVPVRLPPTPWQRLLHYSGLVAWCVVLLFAVWKLSKIVK